NNIQQEFGTIDHVDKLNMDDVVSDLIDVESDIKVEVTTNIKLNSILNGGVEDPMHLLAIIEKDISQRYR
ncbi:hypothetical protein J1N35_018931, partial [Gossypium stocksii]